jgi:ABC-type transporter Mla MlaB component
MVLRIDNSTNSEFVIFTLSGRLENKKIIELLQILASQQANQKIAFDLRDVTLIDKRSVEFFAECEAQGAELWNCSPYLREWILRIRGTNGI